MDPANGQIDISAFKHVVVPLGVIIGLGVAHIVTSVSRLFENRKRVEFSLGPAIWTAILFLLLVGLWWVIWTWREIESDRWSFFSLILLLIGPALIYFAVALLLPTTVPDEGIKLGSRFESIGRMFYLALALAIIWFALVELVLLQLPFFVPQRALQSIYLVLVLSGVVFPSQRAATILGALFLLVLVGALVTIRAALG